MTESGKLVSMSSRMKSQAQAPAVSTRREAARKLTADLAAAAGTPSSAEAVKRAMDAFLPEEDDGDPRARKRRRILEAGTALLVRQGYRKTSMDEVARDAHVAKGTLYLYFPTKAELLAAAMAEEKARFAPRMAGMLDPALSPRERVRFLVKAVFAGLPEMPLMMRMLAGDAEVHHALNELGRHLEKPVLSIQVDYVRGLVAAAAPGLPEERTTTVAQVVLALIYAAPTLLDARLRGAVPVEAFADALADLVVDGLGNAATTGAGTPPRRGRR